jgi:glucokinase
MRILALDIGGTAVKYGLFEDKDVFYGQFSVKDEQDQENIPKSICNFALEHAPDCIAISAPGPFDFETGTGLMTHKLLSLYKISLKEELHKVLPNTKTLFVHDSTAFAIGVMNKYPNLKQVNFAVVMLGTGLGYTCINDGKVILNKNQTPLHPLWNRPFKDGKSEDYVSTKALLTEALTLGYKLNNIKDMATIARDKDKAVLKIFQNYGANLGLCIKNAMSADSFSEVVIGGQISRSWDLMQESFEKECNIKYTIIDDPVSCAVNGLYDCALNGKDIFCKICEE